MKIFIIILLFAFNACASEILSEQQIIEIAKKEFAAHKDNYPGYEKKLNIQSSDKKTVTIQIGSQVPDLVDGVPPSVTINRISGQVIKYYPGCC